MLDSRVYLTSKHGHEIEVYADQLLGDGKDMGENLDMSCDEPLTDAQVHECLYQWEVIQEQRELEELGTDSV
jgi:hypothetical protein